MSLRDYLKRKRSSSEIRIVDQTISKRFEIAGILKDLEPEIVQFNQVQESEFPVVGNIFPTKQSFADYFEIPTSEIIPLMQNAADNPSQPETVADAPCQEVVIENPSLDMLPILMHCAEDGGNYISSGVFLARHPEHGQNADFHRSMQFSPTEMSVRIVKGRHFDHFLNDLGKLDIAICIGNSPAVLAAAATSVNLGDDELQIANTLEPMQVVKALHSEVLIPAETEIVLEGTVYLDRKHAEGPFVDLTGTYDVIRQEPVFELKAITHRKDAFWHALLPGALEHKLLMGMPREPTIFRKVNEAVKCLDVNVNPGGCSWLHAVVQIKKENPDDGIKAITAAFNGHSSCKHVYVVDEDIDIYDPLEVEWAKATRFQADSDMLVYDKAPGSSLDPSAEPGTKMTTRVGFDLTKPPGDASDHYNKADFPEGMAKKFGL